MSPPERSRDADLLRPFLLEDRVERLESVLASRLRGVTVVLEHVHDPGNISAVLRTCEALGVQDVHVIESETAPFRVVYDITQGCHRWLDIHRTDDGPTSLLALRGRGYRLYGSYLDRSAVPLEDLDFSLPAALIFGNEHRGITDTTREACDRLFRIPMRGMTRSFNISVAAALTLAHATLARRAAVGRDGDICSSELADLRDRWYRAEVRSAERVLADLRGREDPRAGRE